MRFDPVSIVFTISILALGIFGFITKGSTVSLVSSTIFAIFLGAATYFEGTRK